MSIERPDKDVYSLHRYLNGDGTPDYTKIFSEDGSLGFLRHADTWLLGHLENQPDIIREDRGLKAHLKDCGECRKKLKPEKTKGQSDLPLDPE